MEKLVTVVVPVYQAEGFLDACVESLVGQSYRNLEILLIDDGSPDDCPRICEEWATRDDRIRVVHRENAGLGEARNLGMKLAKGEYLCFVDSDDFLEKRAIETARRQEADVVVFGFSDVDISGNVLERYVPRLEKYEFWGEEVRSDFLPLFLSGGRKEGIFPGVCWCLFSTALLRRVNWRFPSEREIICEDIFGLLLLFPFAEKVVVLPEALYCYRKREESLSRYYRADRFEKGKIFLKKAWEICEKAGYSEEIRRSCAEPFLGLALAAMKQARGRKLKEMVEDPLFREAAALGRADGWKKGLFYWTVKKKWFFLGKLLVMLRK